MRERLSVADIINDAPQAVKDAMAECERAGLVFLIHFGTGNAVDIAARMAIAEKQGNLNEWMREHGYAKVTA